MRNYKKVGLVVPAYNEQKRIAETLKNLCKQDYTPCEIVVVDNNSKDDTYAIAQGFDVKVVQEQQQGYIYAVNRGAKELNVDYIAICDADTLYPENWVSQMVAVFQKQPDVVAVYGSASTYDAGPFQNKVNTWLYTGFLFLSKCLGLHNTSGFNFMMKQDVFHKVGGYDPNYKKMSPDIELGKRIGQQGKILFKPSITVASSFRRYQEGGALQTQWMFLKSWWAMLRGHEPSVAYDDYNISVG